ncbi:unnamed protein product [Rotaria sordida]|uniref:Uncharacterized protein n=1 Tax=Rotaria sordida TaxID=392033 RepID=A0A815LZN0_9BILA|nr:unnamed protein product [Rotaria sordida]
MFSSRSRHTHYQQTNRSYYGIILLLAELSRSSHLPPITLIIIILNAPRQDAINAAKQAKKAKAQQKKVVQAATVKTGKPVKKQEKIQKNIPKMGPKKGTQR